MQNQQNSASGLMSIVCNLFGHKWNGCKCDRCGKTRDEQHDWHGCKCSRCGKTNATIYRVVTLSKGVFNIKTNPLGYIGGIKQLEDVFDNLVKDDVSYQSTKASWLGANKEFEVLINLDVLIGPLRWLASATGDSLDTIQELTGIRLFIAQSVFQWGQEKIAYSVCDYFSRTETIEVPHNSTEPSKDNMCPYYKDTKCIAGGQVNNCSANPHNYGSCYVYKYNSTGDYRTLYK